MCFCMDAVDRLKLRHLKMKIGRDKIEEQRCAVEKVGKYIDRKRKTNRTNGELLIIQKSINITK